MYADIEHLSRTDSRLSLMTDAGSLYVEVDHDASRALAARMYVSKHRCCISMLTMMPPCLGRGQLCQRMIFDCLNAPTTLPLVKTEKFCLNSIAFCC